MRALPVLLVLAACDPDGGVALRFERPEDPSLDPLTDDVRELTLWATAGGEEVFQATRPYDAAVRFGQLPLGQDVRFAVGGSAATGQVIAYGKSGDPVDVTVDDAIEVTLPVRRPFSYVAGAEGVIALDGSLGDDYVTALGDGAAAAAVSATPDGRSIVVAQGASLVSISTSTHLAEGGEVALEAAATDLAISPDGRWAVVAHAEPSGVSIVDRATAQASFVATPPVGQLAVSADTVWVIVDPLNSLFCSPMSSLLAIPLDDPASAGDPVPLDAPASDLAVDRDGRPLVVLPCADRIVDESLTPVLEVDGVSAVTVAGDTIWATGHVDGEAAHIILASVPLAGGEPALIDLPTLEERALAPEFDAPGQNASIQATADLASAYDLTVLPDGEHAAILVAAVYFTEEVGDAGFGVPILPAVTMVTYEYQLVQLDSGLGAQRLRTSCSIEWEPGAYVDDFRCGQAPGQDVSSVSFTPEGLSALYGSR